MRTGPPTSQPIKNPPYLRSSAPKIGPKIKPKMRVLRRREGSSSKMGGFFVPAPKKEESTFSIFSTRRPNKLPFLFCFRTRFNQPWLDFWASEARSSARSSSSQIGPKIEIGPLLALPRLRPDLPPSHPTPHRRTPHRCAVFALGCPGFGFDR